MIPTIEECIVCDQIRPELYGKLIILGFLGICPNVDVAIGRLDQPTTLSFLLLGGPGDEELKVRFDIFDEVANRVVASIASAAIRVIPMARTTLAPAFVLTFGHVGPFSVRCYINEEMRYRGGFRVSQGVQLPSP